MEGALNHERVSPDEVLAEMRRSGLERLEQVKWAVLESDGKISIIPEDHVRRVLPSQPRGEKASV